MNVTHRVRLDMTKKSYAPQVEIMQNDTGRKIDAVLFEGTKPWIPQNVGNVIIQYDKPDGVSGKYDTLPNGKRAWSVSENVVTISLAPEVCTVPGNTDLCIRLISGDKEVSTFVITLSVTRIPNEESRSEEYKEIRGFLSVPYGVAKVGQILEVSAITEDGMVAELKTVNKTDPNWGTGHNTAQGSPITIESSYQPPYMKALTLYGKSTQDGIPTPDTPVGIVSVGDGGSMDVTVDDGSENIAISTFATGLPLYGIPITSGGNVTIDGQQYLADTLEIYANGSGRVVKRVGKYFLKNLTPVLIANEKGNYFNYSLRVGAHTGMGSHLKFVTFNYTNVGANKNTFGFTSSKTIMSVIPGQNYTLEEWTAITNDTDMYVLVPLENATETALTPEEVQAFLAMQTFVPVTNLYNSEGAHMELVYASEQMAANERSEARIKALENAILAMGSNV